MGRDQKPRRPLAFLLAQVGAHAASRFAERLRAIDLTPPDAGILRLLAINSGLSQQELSARLGIHPSRLVAILDELERRKLLERRAHDEDRRQYALHLTERGRATMGELGKIGRAHTDALCAALTSDERDTLAELLQKIADEQGLQPGIHPGYKRMK